MKCFHHNDMDGRSAGAIVALYEDNYNQDDFIEVDYMQPLPLHLVSKGEKVYFVDYSFKEDTIWQLDELLKKTEWIVWCDHHTSSIELLEKRPDLKNIRGIVKDKISGVGLVYMYLYNKKDITDCPKFIQLVSDYDCWIYKFGDVTTHFKLGVDSIDNSALSRLWTDLIEDIGYDYLDYITSKGATIKSYINEDNSQYLSQYGYESELEGILCYVVNRKSNSWIFGDKINQYPFVSVYAFNGSKFSYSLFSTDKSFDCSKLAEKFGGGGHKGAAGFSSDKLLFKKVK